MAKCADCKYYQTINPSIGICRFGNPLPQYYLVSPSRGDKWRAGDFYRVFWPRVEGSNIPCGSYHP